MLLRILVVVLLIVGVLIFAVTRPDIVRIERSITINASPERIFPLINDFHNWSRWAPQDREDPGIRRTYAGSASGEGAISDWTGTGSTGSGRMLITKSVPSTNVAVTVDWVKPFAAHNLNEFTLEPHGATTRVIWSMQGTNVYVMKLMSVFTNTDRFMGKHFETGLANLKTAAESGGR